MQITGYPDQKPTICKGVFYSLISSLISAIVRGIFMSGVSAGPLPKRYSLSKQVATTASIGFVCGALIYYLFSRKDRGFCSREASTEPLLPTTHREPNSR